MYYTDPMSFDRARHSQKIGQKLKEKHGTDFFSNINPRRKLSFERVLRMLEEYDNRLTNKKTVSDIAKKYGVTAANVYYHANRR